LKPLTQALKLLKACEQHVRELDPDRMPSQCAGSQGHWQGKGGGTQCVPVMPMCGTDLQPLNGPLAHSHKQLPFNQEIKSLQTPWKPF
jgi:hypothetical protein